MIWTQIFMRTAVIFLVTMTMLANESDANIHAEWTQLTVGPPMESVRVLETDGYRLFLGTHDGLYLSRDHGYTWRLTLPDRQITAIAVGKNALYAGTSKQGLFRSDNRGVTWQNKSARAPIKQIVVLRSGTVIAGRYPAGAYISFNRGDSWDDIYDHWLAKLSHLGYNIWSITEFDGYLWASTSSGGIIRTPDKGKTWKWATEYFKLGRVSDWAEFNDRLYAAGESGFGRWSEKQGEWEYLTEGLPTGDERPHLINLAVNRGRIFAGLRRHGVYLFDERSETWIPAGLDGLTVTSLVSHQSDLYAATGESIYRASIPIVQPYAKAATTWSAIKRR